MTRSLVILLLLAALFPAALWAADNTGEAKLREALRAVTLQLRAAETDRDNLQAAQAQAAQEKKTLTAQVDALNKQAAADKEARDAQDKAIAGLNGKITDQAAEIAGLKDSVEKWKVSQKQAADLAANKEAQRAKLTGDVLLLERKIADREAKNLALFKLGNEILTRYERFGLGDAIGAREPFSGLTRVKLENLVQDYQDKLLAQKVKPEKTPSTQ
jgi:chromosome segregation ATPase